MVTCNICRENKDPEDFTERFICTDCYSHKVDQDYEMIKDNQLEGGTK